MEVSLGFQRVALPFKKYVEFHHQYFIFLYFAYHYAGCVGQVAGNCREVEGCNTGNESLQRSVSHQVENTFGVLGDGLILHQLFGKETVEPEEVSQLTSSINFSLKCIIFLLLEIKTKIPE